MSKPNFRILTNYLILAEGRDTTLFLRYYLNSEALKYDERFGKDIQVVDFHGINELKAFISNLTKMEGFERLKALLIVRDAETNAIEAVRSVQTALSDNQLPMPNGCNIWKSDEKISTAFTLLPLCSENPTEGALEDLCWIILKKEKQTEGMRDDVSRFVSTMKDEYHSITSHEHKSRLHTYFLVNQKFISLKMGEAAKAGAFDWENKPLVPLKELMSGGLR